MIDGVRFSSIKPILRVGLLLALIVSVSLWLYWSSASKYPEIERLSTVTWTLEEYKTYFTDLAHKKGAVYAFKILREADIAFGVDTHAIGHEIGYVLYEQQGVAGLGECTDRFRGAACAHAIVIQEFVHEGSAALERLAKTCAEQPVESFERADCLHGLGHGILAYLGYDFERAVGQCKDVSNIVSKGNTSGNADDMWYECIDGATMEMLQGNHDKVVWEKAKPTYLPISDVFMPCDASFMPEAMQPACYAYIRARIVPDVRKHNNDATIDATTYKEAISYCERIPIAQVANREACYGGFGVDFVYFVNGYDDRKFEDMEDDALRTVHDLCALSETLDAISPCTLTAADMVLSRGEGLRAASAFCRLTPDPVVKERCYNTIIDLSEKYLPGQGLRALCTFLPVDQQTACSSV